MAFPEVRKNVNRFGDAPQMDRPNRDVPTVAAPLAVAPALVLLALGANRLGLIHLDMGDDQGHWPLRPGAAREEPVMRRSNTGVAAGVIRCILYMTQCNVILTL